MESASVDQARILLRSHGEVRPQPALDWTGEVELPPALAVYYWDIGPLDVEITGYGNPFSLPSLGKLWDFQAGYRRNSRTRSDGP